MDEWKVPASKIQQAKANIVETISKYVELKKHGQEYQACCPFHSENTPSFTITPDKGWYCFGCGESGGDAIDFVMKLEKVDFREAVKRIVGDLPADRVVQPIRQTVKNVESDWQPIIPAPAHATPIMAGSRTTELYNPKREAEGKARTSFAPKKVYEFRGECGVVLGYVLRMEWPKKDRETGAILRNEDGSEKREKITPQVVWCVNKKTGEEMWVMTSFPRPRPIYGLDKLYAHPKAQVLLVEGEKACDAAQALYEAAGIPRDKLIVLSWAGGTKAAQYTDWTPLAGRSVALWPDADQRPYPTSHEKAGQLIPFIEQGGTACMLDIAARVDGVAASIKFITPPDGVPDGWDLADELPAGFNLLAHTKAAALPIDEFRAKHVVAQAAADLDEAMPWEEQDVEELALAVGAPVTRAAPTQRKPDLKLVQGGVAGGDDEHTDELVGNGYFTILGYDRCDYFFFQHEKRQVLTYRKGDFSDSGLMELAPINWWEEHFPASKEGVNKKAAINWVFRTANSRGIYDPSRVRGRGAWTDAGRSVFHHGAWLTVDGIQTSITHIKSAYVYQVERNMPTPAAEPMTDEEGTWLVSVAELARWSMPGSAALFAGFVMLAPICGALPWRSHIWLTGGAGTGKSTLQSKYLGSLLRDISVYATGDSTEPGIRQKLQADALPVLIDEAESNTDRDKQRIESIIGMIRKTSTESQAQTLKGTVSGDGQSFHVRSMFCLASINVNMPGKADSDRLTKLALRPPVLGSADHWDRLEAELNKIEEDGEIANRLLARALSMMPVILESVKVFRRAAATHFGTQRQGDQFGTLLAGSWCLQKSHVPSEAEAMVLIRGYKWDEHVEDNDQDDASRAVEALLGAKMRTKSISGSTDEYSVYELIRECSPLHRHNLVENQIADDTLRRHGIRVELSSGELWFGTSVSNLVKIVKDMPFVTDLRGQLLRVKGAKRVQGSKKFNGSDSKVVSIPLAPILGDEKEAGETEELPI